MYALIKAKKRQHVRDVLQLREERERAAVVAFPKFDEGKSGVLDRAQLGALLAHLHPDAPVDDETVGYVFHICVNQPQGESEDCEGVRVGQMAGVTRHYAYAASKESEMATLFDKHDTDRSGKLDRAQMTQALVDVERVQTPAHSTTCRDL